MVEWFRTYYVETIRHTDRTRDGQIDEVIPIYPLLRGVGGL